MTTKLSALLQNGIILYLFINSHITSLKVFDYLRLGTDKPLRMLLYWQYVSFPRATLDYILLSLNLHVGETVTFFKYL